MRLNIPLTGAPELNAVAQVLESGYLTQGPKVAEFEKLVAAYSGSTFSFATSSATTGIHLALRAVGVQPGDEVIIPDFSFPATANAVIQQGATPILVDIDLNTFNMDPMNIRSAISNKTAAIMPVHAFGLPADMDPINEISDRHGIPVVEDAACALGGIYKGAQAGALGTAGVFSFHPRKIITTGEGGMITTSDQRLAEKISILRTHGAVRGSHYLDFVDAGYNYRLSDVLGAIGVVQMQRLQEILDERRNLANKYDALFADMKGVKPPFVPELTSHTYQSYVLLLDAEIDRNRVIDLMRERDIETTLGTYSMHLQPYFRGRFGIDDSQLPKSTRAHKSALTIPLYPQMKLSELSQVAESLAEVLPLAG